MLYERDVPTFVAPLIVLAMGAVIGAVSGLLVTKIRIPSFLVTLGMLSIFSGLALTVTDTRPVPILDDTFSTLSSGTARSSASRRRSGGRSS